MNTKEIAQVKSLMGETANLLRLRLSEKPELRQEFLNRVNTNSFGVLVINPLLQRLKESNLSELLIDNNGQGTKLHAFVMQVHKDELQGIPSAISEFLKPGVEAYDAIKDEVTEVVERFFIERSLKSEDLERLEINRQLKINYEVPTTGKKVAASKDYSYLELIYGLVLNVIAGTESEKEVIPPDVFSARDNVSFDDARERLKQSAFNIVAADGKKVLLLTQASLDAVKEVILADEKGQGLVAVNDDASVGDSDIKDLNAGPQPATPKKEAAPIGSKIIIEKNQQMAVDLLRNRLIEKPELQGYVKSKYKQDVFSPNFLKALVAEVEEQGLTNEKIVVDGQTYKLMQFLAILPSLQKGSSADAFFKPIFDKYDSLAEQIVERAMKYLTGQRLTQEDVDAFKVTKDIELVLPVVPGVQFSKAPELRFNIKLNEESLFSFFAAAVMASNFSDNSIATKHSHKYLPEGLLTPSDRITYSLLYKSADFHADKVKAEGNTKPTLVYVAQRAFFESIEQSARGERISSVEEIYAWSKLTVDQSEEIDICRNIFKEVVDLYRLRLQEKPLLQDEFIKNYEKVLFEQYFKGARLNEALGKGTIALGPKKYSITEFVAEHCKIQGNMLGVPRRLFTPVLDIYKKGTEERIACAREFFLGSMQGQDIERFRKPEQYSIDLDTSGLLIASNNANHPFIWSESQLSLISYAVSNSMQMDMLPKGLLDDADINWMSTSFKQLSKAFENARDIGVMQRGAMPIVIADFFEEMAIERIAGNDKLASFFEAPKTVEEPIEAVELVETTLTPSSSGNAKLDAGIQKCASNFESGLNLIRLRLAESSKETQEKFYENLEEIIFYETLRDLSLIRAAGGQAMVRFQGEEVKFTDFARLHFKLDGNVPQVAREYFEPLHKIYAEYADEVKTGMRKFFGSDSLVGDDIKSYTTPKLLTAKIKPVPGVSVIKGQSEIEVKWFKCVPDFINYSFTQAALLRDKNRIQLFPEGMLTANDAEFLHNKAVTMRAAHKEVEKLTDRTLGSYAAEFIVRMFARRIEGIDPVFGSETAQQTSATAKPKADEESAHLEKAKESVLGILSIIRHRLHEKPEIQERFFESYARALFEHNIASLIMDSGAGDDAKIKTGNGNYEFHIFMYQYFGLHKKAFPAIEKFLAPAYAPYNSSRDQFIATARDIFLNGTFEGKDIAEFTAEERHSAVLSSRAGVTIIGHDNIDIDYKRTRLAYFANTLYYSIIDNRSENINFLEEIFSASEMDVLIKHAADLKDAYKLGFGHRVNKNPELALFARSYEGVQDYQLDEGVADLMSEIVEGYLQQRIAGHDLLHVQIATPAAQAEALPLKPEEAASNPDNDIYAKEFRSHLQECIDLIRMRLSAAPKHKQEEFHKGMESVIFNSTLVGANLKEHRNTWISAQLPSKVYNFEDFVERNLKLEGQVLGIAKRYFAPVMTMYHSHSPEIYDKMRKFFGTDLLVNESFEDFTRSERFSAILRPVDGINITGTSSDIKFEWHTNPTAFIAYFYLNSIEKDKSEFRMLPKGVLQDGDLEFIYAKTKEAFALQAEFDKATDDEKGFVITAIEQIIADRISGKDALIAAAALPDAVADDIKKEEPQPEEVAEPQPEPQPEPELPAEVIAEELPVIEEPPAYLEMAKENLLGILSIVRHRLHEKPELQEKFFESYKKALFKHAIRDCMLETVKESIDLRGITIKSAGSNPTLYQFMERFYDPDAEMFPAIRTFLEPAFRFYNTDNEQFVSTARAIFLNGSLEGRDIAEFTADKSQAVSLKSVPGVLIKGKNSIDFGGVKSHLDYFCDAFYHELVFKDEIKTAFFEGMFSADELEVLTAYASDFKAAYKEAALQKTTGTNIMPFVAGVFKDYLQQKIAGHDPLHVEIAAPVIEPEILPEEPEAEQAQTAEEPAPSPEPQPGPAPEEPAPAPVPQEEIILPAANISFDAAAEEECYRESLHELLAQTKPIVEQNIKDGFVYFKCRTQFSAGKTPAISLSFFDKSGEVREYALTDHALIFSMHETVLTLAKVTDIKTCLQSWVLNNAGIVPYRGFNFGALGGIVNKDDLIPILSHEVSTGTTVRAADIFAIKIRAKDRADGPMLEFTVPLGLPYKATEVEQAKKRCGQVFEFIRHANEKGVKLTCSELVSSLKYAAIRTGESWADITTMPLEGYEKPMQFAVNHHGQHIEFSSCNIAYREDSYVLNYNLKLICGDEVQSKVRTQNLHTSDLELAQARAFEALEGAQIGGIKIPGFMEYIESTMSEYNKRKWTFVRSGNNDILFSESYSLKQVFGSVKRYEDDLAVRYSISESDKEGVALLTLDLMRSCSPDLNSRALPQPEQFMASQDGSIRRLPITIQLKIAQQENMPELVKMLAENVANTTKHAVGEHYSDISLDAESSEVRRKHVPVFRTARVANSFFTAVSSECEKIFGVKPDMPANLKSFANGTSARKASAKQVNQI